MRIRAWRLGDDLDVALSGGDREHIGAVAVSQPRPSHAPGGGTSATTSVIALLGHKEDELARRVAARLSREFGVTVCVSCGVHVDAITPREIDDVEELADELTVALVVRLRSGRP